MFLVVREVVLGSRNLTVMLSMLSSQVSGCLDALRISRIRLDECTWAISPMHPRCLDMTSLLDVTVTEEGGKEMFFLL